MILHVALELPVRKLFDYFPNDGEPIPEPGQRVQVTCAGTKRCGLVMSVSTESNLPVNKIRSIDSVFNDMPPIAGPLRALISHTASYYQLPVGKVAFTALPAIFRRPRFAVLPDDAQIGAPDPFDPGEQPAAVELGSAERSVLARLEQDGGPLLITGRDESAVRIAVSAAVDAIMAGGTALLITPGMAQADLLRQEIAVRLPAAGAVALHSRLTDREQLDAWLSAASGRARAVTGSRSAVFAPLRNLRLVAVLDESNPSHRSWQGLSYSARDMAARRVMYEGNGCRLLLTSAFPSMELRQAVLDKRVHQAVLDRSSSMPAHSLVVADIAGRRLFGGVSPELENGVRRELARGGVAAVLINRGRRGGVLFCPNCRRVPKCKRCGDRQVADGGNSRCLRCSMVREMAKSCKVCGNIGFEAMRAGSSRLAETLATRLPEARIARVEGDFDARQMREQICAGKYDVVVGGKQLVALGLQFGTVGIADADTMLHAPELRAAEHMLETILRLVKTDNGSHVIVQTRFADHQVFEALRKGSYEIFASRELQERRQAGLPPYRRLALLKVDADSEEEAVKFIGGARKMAESCKSSKVHLLEPVKANGRNAAMRNRMQLMVSAPDRKIICSTLTSWMSLLEEISLPKNLEWQIEVDPESW